MLAVGLIEESVKLAVPLWLFLRRRFPAPADGMLAGVAAGTGFAVLESMATDWWRSFTPAVGSAPPKSCC